MTKQTKDMGKIKHNDCNSKEYFAWAELKKRCLNKKSSRYFSYGGRGITVCDRWLASYQNFLDDMGRAPSNRHSLDRKDNDGNYEPDNCRWATPKEQANNRRTSKYVIYKGESKTLSQWADKINVPFNTLRWRINLGWSVDRAFRTPVKHYKST